MLDNILRHTLKNAATSGGEKAMKASVKQAIAKQRPLNFKNVKSLKNKLQDNPVIFDVDRVSDRYSQFLNKPARRGDDKIYPKEAGAKYLAEAKAYWAKNKTFKGFKRYVDPETGVATHRIKDGSVMLKSGERAAKSKRLNADQLELAQRQLNSKEQTFGPSGRNKLVHHRAELSFIEAIARGLNAKDRRAFYEYVHKDNRWMSLKLGDEEVNLLGLLDDADFHSVHVDAHKLLKMAGLKPHTTDFTGATMEQRFGFLDEITPLLDQIDEFIYNQRMAGKYPDLRFESGPRKGQKRFKPFQRPSQEKRTRNRTRQFKRPSEIARNREALKISGRPSQRSKR